MTLRPRSTDPQTGRPLRDRRLIPNPCLRALIVSCCLALGVSATDAAAPAPAPAAQGEATMQAAESDPPTSATS
jgi:hypothetical protein